MIFCGISICCQHYSHRSEPTQPHTLTHAAHLRFNVWFEYLYRNLFMRGAWAGGEQGWQVAVAIVPHVYICRSFRSHDFYRLSVEIACVCARCDWFTISIGFYVFVYVFQFNDSKFYQTTSMHMITFQRKNSTKAPSHSGLTITNQSRYRWKKIGPDNMNEVKQKHIYCHMPTTIAMHINDQMISFDCGRNLSTLVTILDCRLL